jgi:hypothetical protein
MYGSSCIMRGMSSNVKGIPLMKYISTISPLW